jgi:hypothetical protein
MHESGPGLARKGVLGLSILTRGHCFLADPPTLSPAGASTLRENGEKRSEKRAPQIV